MGALFSVFVSPESFSYDVTKDSYCHSPESLNTVLTGKTRVAGGEMAEGGTGRWSNGHYGIR
jgi:hypothetical protein